MIVIFTSCGQNLDSLNFVGKNYILESQDNFIQFISKDSIDYYSIHGLGEKKISKNKAFWEYKNDSTITIVVIYEPEFENAIFKLMYNRQKDLWTDLDEPGAYRRMKKITYKEFTLEEF